MLDTGYDWTGKQIARITLPINPADLAVATPCAKWDLRQVLNHQVGVVDMLADRVTGADNAAASWAGSVAQQLADSNIIGTDPEAAYAAAVDKIRAVWRTPGLFDRTCVLPFGEVPVRTAATVALIDVVVHGWDVAKALGGTEEIPPTLAESILELAPPIVERARGRAFGPAITSLPPDATATDRLVALLGRQP